MDINGIVTSKMLWSFVDDHSASEFPGGFRGFRGMDYNDIQSQKILGEVSSHVSPVFHGEKNI